MKLLQWRVVGDLLARERKSLEVHELGSIFPMMTDDQLDGLAASVKEIGLIKSITLHQGKILDGKCRYEACRRAGVMPTFRVFPGDFPHYHGDALAFVLSANLYRAHYSASQRAAMAAEVMPFLSEPNWR